MSTRLCSRLPAFAFKAAAVAIAALVPLVFGVFATSGTAPAVAATMASPVPEERVVEHPAPETVGERVARIAVRAVGIPYRWGGGSPSSGFDCSGLVRWAYGRIGVDLPHSSYALYGEGRRVPEAKMEPGDILFFEGLGHVGLYLGKGRMVHAPQSGRSVEIVRLGGLGYGGRLIGARRVVAA